MKLGSSSVYPTYAQFEEFLIGRTRAMENLNLHISVFGLQKKRYASSSGNPSTKIAAHVATSSTNTGTITCPLYGTLHYLAKCDHYLLKTLPKRRDIIVKKRCFNCLGLHSASKCNSTKRCLKCGKKHHISIHDVNNKYSYKQNADMQTRSESAQSEQLQTSAQ